jgi:hypothetical protein
MNSEQDLINRLMISKKIMEKSDQIGRGQAIPSTPTLEEYQPVSGNYNIPQEFLQESQQQKSYKTETPTQDRILNSRLPDEIKQLMIQHPIQQPTMGVNTGVGLSEDLVERASRLMNTNAKGDVIQQPRKQQQINESMSNPNLKSIIRETMEEVLKENGLLIESETKSNDLFKFRVGDHIFEGKIVRVKKVSK